jgi:hypothetical protein
VEGARSSAAAGGSVPTMPVAVRHFAANDPDHRGPFPIGIVAFATRVPLVCLPARKDGACAPLGDGVASRSSVPLWRARISRQEVSASA